MFEGNNSKKIEHLESEKDLLWERIVQLEKEVKERSSDNEKEAKQASKMTAQYRNKAETRFEESEKILKKLLRVESEIDERLLNIKSKQKIIKEASEDLLSKKNELSNFLNTVNIAYEDHPEIEGEIETINSLILEIKEVYSKSNTLHKGIVSKKLEIDELHREIIGYEENRDGVTVPVEGIQGQLETVYDNLNEDSETLFSRIKELRDISRNQYENFVKENQNDLDNIKSESKTEYEKINKKIESLLPNALTAGLSSAFIAKKNEEEKVYNDNRNIFNKGIISIAISAMLPIGISVFYLLSEATLSDTIEKAPKVMLAFLPLFGPLIWLTISANKKVNLSKRLIEEYSHKQVLSMTIEGLSEQIENIDDTDLSEELRIKLLNSFLDVTKENPGKLIRNYQKSDNPILNLFDKDNKKGKSIINKIEDNTKGFIDKASEEIKGTITSN